MSRIVNTRSNNRYRILFEYINEGSFDTELYLYYARQYDQIVFLLQQEKLPLLEGVN